MNEETAQLIQQMEFIGKKLEAKGIPFMFAVWDDSDPNEVVVNLVTTSRKKLDPGISLDTRRHFHNSVQAFKSGATSIERKGEG